jgi:hypothetical protein
MTSVAPEEDRMAEIRRLDPHDPLPDGPGKHLIVLRRFEEDEPGRTLVEIIRSSRPGSLEPARAVRADGRPMSLKEAIESAREVASTEGLDLIYIVDRVAGPRERDILHHHGDHSVHMEGLDDFDLEEGERGSDMRDRRG